MAARLHQLLRAGDYDALVTELAVRLDMAVDPVRLSRYCEQFTPLVRDPCGKDRADDTVVAWLKNRMAELGMFRVGCEHDEIVLATTLHVGFVSVVETDEHISRLRNIEVERKEESQVARSKVFSTNEVIHPVDRVAIRVAPDRR